MIYIGKNWISNFVANLCNVYAVIFTYIWRGKEENVKPPQIQNGGINMNTKMMIAAVELAGDARRQIEEIEKNEDLRNAMEIAGLLEELKMLAAALENVGGKENE